MSDDRWSPQDSRSVRSAWVWRGFLFMALVALGVVIIFATNARYGMAVAWGVIAAGWFSIAMWLWYQHNKLQQ